MRLTLTVLTICFAASFQAKSAETVSYIVVRGAVIGCEDWTDRILNLINVKDEPNPSILGLPSIDVWGLDAAQIEESVLDTIEKSTGTKPKTLSVELIDSEPEYRLLINEYMYSLNNLMRGQCPRQFKKGNNHQRPIIDEKMEEIRRQEMARLVV